MNKIRTRFAPSPTGYMHIGNLRTALYTYLIAKHENGDFILRIEDTDQERFVEGAIDVIYNSLELSGFKIDESPRDGGDYGPYTQSERIPLYKKYAEKLIENGSAYYCFCSKERLDMLKSNQEMLKRPFKYDKNCASLTKEEIDEKIARGDSYVIRQNNPLTGVTVFNDVLFGRIEVDNSELEDMVLIKSDGYPTYNFANVVDDHLMKITHIVRGNEYLSSSPKYNRLYEAFGWDVPTYIHVPPILKDANTKLSKRNGDASFEDLLSKGYLKEAIINYIALLGWSPKDNDEIFNLDTLIKIFDYNNISKSPAVFDDLKLRHINSTYIKALSIEDFHSLALPYYKDAILNKDIDLLSVSKLLHNRIDILSEIPEKVVFLDNLCDYSTDIYIHKKMKTDKEISLSSLNSVLPVLNNINEWNLETLHKDVEALIKELDIKNGQMLWPIRTALTGLPFTPGGAFEVAEILGKDETIKRIEKGIELLKMN